MTQPEAILERIAALADEWKLANLRPQIAACRNLLHARNGIDVAVLGRFKAGKSSFLNHLTGRDVLPIGVVPLTAVITRLRYNGTERAEVHFLDGTTKTIPLGEISSFVGENENPNNLKQVAAVEIGLPELNPLAPLQFVDTPGLGSAFAHNTEVALNWLPNVSAALVAVSSDAPLSERDLALLEELRHHTPKIALLLTKADLLTGPQRTEVLNFVRQQLQGKWNGDLPVFFYSVKPELSALKAELEQNLLLPLLRYRDDAAGQILQHKLSSLAAQALNYLQIALASATQAESARQALGKSLDEERRQFDVFREELRVLAHEWSAQALDWSLTRLQPVQRELQAKATAELQAQFARWQLRLPAFLEAYDRWLRGFLHREIGTVSHSQRAMFCAPLDNARRHLERALRGFQDRLADHVRAAFGLTLTRHEFKLEVNEPSAPPVNVGYLDAAFSSVSFAIPMTLFRGLIERALVRKARWEVEKNLSRLADDWRNRVCAATEELRAQTGRHAGNELATLAQMLAQTKSDEPRLCEAVKELEILPGNFVS
jgi:GTP-binding protein EngB required for normal cell division